MSDPSTPTAFIFSVAIEDSDDAALFREISGLETERTPETIVEGGENRFVHRLPKAVKHTHLTCKHGLIAANHSMMTWVEETLLTGLSSPIQPKGMTVSLIGSDDETVAAWTLTQVYPLKWSVGGLDEMKNEFAVESIEFAYNTVKRTT